MNVDLDSDELAFLLYLLHQNRDDIKRHVKDPGNRAQAVKKNNQIRNKFEMAQHAAKQPV
jgi:hypothetical protein